MVRNVSLGHQVPECACSVMSRCRRWPPVAAAPTGSTVDLSISGVPNIPAQLVSGDPVVSTNRSVWCRQLHDELASAVAVQVQLIETATTEKYSTTPRNARCA